MGGGAHGFSIAITGGFTGFKVQGSRFRVLNREPFEPLSDGI
jgi:hypothetical protein